MLRNELLNHMGVEDLNQRYKESYIRYENKTWFCQGFVQEGGGHGIYIYLIGPDEGDGASKQKFKWDQLDTERPPSRWYLTKKYGPVLFRLLVKKQFSRGVSHRNSNVWTPQELGVRVQIGNCVQEIMNPQNHDMGWRQVMHYKDLTTPGTKLLSPLLVKLHVQHTEVLYYRDSRIAFFNDGKIVLLNPLFEDELREVIIGATFSNEKKRPQEADTYEKLKKYNAFQWPPLDEGVVIAGAGGAGGPVGRQALVWEDVVRNQAAQEEQRVDMEANQINPAGMDERVQVVINRIRGRRVA